MIIFYVHDGRTTTSKKGKKKKSWNKIGRAINITLCLRTYQPLDSKTFSSIIPRWVRFWNMIISTKCCKASHFDLVMTISATMMTSISQFAFYIQSRSFPFTLTISINNMGCTWNCWLLLIQNILFHSLFPQKASFRRHFPSFKFGYPNNFSPSRNAVKNNLREIIRWRNYSTQKLN